MNAARRSIETILRKLDFDDLLSWAGEKIVNRGKSYVKHVDQLACTEDNTLVAWGHRQRTICNFRADRQ